MDLDHATRQRAKPVYGLEPVPDTVQHRALAHRRDPEEHVDRGPAQLL
jgi:hypothetical protein